MRRILNKLSWNDANTLPYKENDTNLNKFMSLVLREIRKLGYTRYVDLQQLSEFIEETYLYEEGEDIDTIMKCLFTTPLKEAKGVAGGYVEMYSQEEDDFE